MTAFTPPTPLWKTLYALLGEQPRTAAELALLTERPLAQVQRTLYRTPWFRRLAPPRGQRTPLWIRAVRAPAWHCRACQAPLPRPHGGYCPPCLRLHRVSVRPRRPAFPPAPARVPRCAACGGTSYRDEDGDWICLACARRVAPAAGADQAGTPA